MEWRKNAEIQILQEYLRIKTPQPSPDYEPCITFLEHQVNMIGLPFNIFCPANYGNPMMVITWEGTDPQLSSIVLNSHMDVVPPNVNSWNFDPFGAEIDNEGKIYGCGAQDMKSVGMQYLAAVRSLKEEGIQLKRTIHILFVPDGENYGCRGIEKFVETQEFEELNVGFMLDEGVASSEDFYWIFYGERTEWRFTADFYRQQGKNVFFQKNTAGDKFEYFLNQIMSLRKAEIQRLEENPQLNYGDVTSFNLTQLNGGVYGNIVPNTIRASFDIRLALDANEKDLDDQICTWCREINDVRITWDHKFSKVDVTAVDESNPFWVAIKYAFDQILDTKYRLGIHPGITDSRHLRKLGIPCLGFSPIKNTPTRLHDYDEFIYADGYLKGIEIYKTILFYLGNATNCYCKYKSSKNNENEN